MSSSSSSTPSSPPLEQLKDYIVFILTPCVVVDITSTANEEGVFANLLGAHCSITEDGIEINYVPVLLLVLCLLAGPLLGVAMTATWVVFGWEGSCLAGCEEVVECC